MTFVQFIKIIINTCLKIFQFEIKLFDVDITFLEIFLGGIVLYTAFYFFFSINK